MIDILLWDVDTKLDLPKRTKRVVIITEHTNPDLIIQSIGLSDDIEYAATFIDDFSGDVASILGTAFVKSLESVIITDSENIAAPLKHFCGQKVGLTEKQLEYYSSMLVSTPRYVDDTGWDLL